MVETTQSLESVLSKALHTSNSTDCPPGLSAAMNWAVFPGGARVRPHLCLAVAAACKGSDKIAVVPAAALELVHCASLVHDDLPCFDNAGIRRGRQSVQAKFGERLAVLAGDALIVKCFEVLADGLPTDAPLVVRLCRTMVLRMGAPSGIAAGQAWECEEDVDVATYHRLKTGALFAAATEMGALAAAQNPDDWSALGLKLGEAFQVADDILDAAGDEEAMGKPVGQDQRLNRPNSVRQLGPAGAVERLRWLVEQAVESIPDCAGKVELSKRIKSETDRLLPSKLAA